MNINIKAKKLIIEAREPRNKKLLNGWNNSQNYLVFIRDGEEVASLSRSEETTGNKWFQFQTNDNYYQPVDNNIAIGFELVAIYDNCITVIEHLPNSKKKRIYF